MLKRKKKVTKLHPFRQAVNIALEPARHVLLAVFNSIF